MGNKVFHRIQRAMNCCTAVDILGAGTMIAAVGALVWGSSTTTEGLTPAGQAAVAATPWWFVACAALVLFLLIARARIEYKRRTYDPTLALMFNERFDSPEMRRARIQAATSLKANLGNLTRTDINLTGVDDVLNFLDTIGFYQHGHQISPEVAHHHFHHWVRGYHQIARDYIGRLRETEPALFEYVKELADMTADIENEQSRGRSIKTLSNEHIAAFLDDEMNLAVDPTYPRNH
jgi:hypothetical protein